MPFEFDRAVVPAALAERRQWLLWKFEQKPKQVKPAKMPYYASKSRRTGTQGSADDRAALVTLDEALAVAQVGAWAGVGFAFLPDDGLIGIDLDKVIEPPWPAETCQIKRGAQRIIEACASYTEYSPSGTGIHIIVAGSMPGVEKSNDIGVEIFCGRQFFTFSANPYPGAPPDVTPISADALARLQQVVRDAKAKRKGVTPATAPAPDTSPAGAAQPDRPAGRTGKSDFQRVNEKAMGNLDAWVPMLFPAAKRVPLGYRVTSEALGRNLQEDLSINVQGIVDFGLADQGDARAGARTPLDLVMEWSANTAPIAALEWLASALGMSEIKIRKCKPPKKLAAPKSISTPGGPPGDIPGDPGPMPPGDDPDDWRRYLITKRGELKECRENVLMILRDHPDWAGVLAADTFAKKIAVRRDSPIGQKAGTEWSANDDVALGLWLAQQEGLTIASMDSMRAAVAYVAARAPFHPVRDYFESIEWDREPRVDGWGPRMLGCVDDEYDRLVGRLFLINMVRRIYEPGCVMRSVPVLEGPQNEGKSTALKLLAEPWYSDTMFRVGDKDAYQLIQGVMLYEISELENFSKAEATAVKAFISSPKDTFRAPYAHSPEGHLRQVMFGGTTNAREYLKDWTGNTRFWPWRTMVEGNIALDLIHKERDQLLAEAVHLYKAGARSYPTREQEKALFAPQQELRMIQHPWAEKVGDYLAMSSVQEYTNLELLEAIGVDIARISPQGMESQTLGKCMQFLGWTKRRRPSDMKWVWVRPPAEPTNSEAPAPSGPETTEQKVGDDDVPF